MTNEYISAMTGTRAEIIKSESASDACATATPISRSASR
jgi:hypothetical protein